MSVFFQSRSFTDFDAFTEAVRDWDLEFLQLDRGRYCGELSQFILDRANLGYARFGRRLQQLGNTPTGLRTFGLLTKASMHMVWRGRPVSGDDLVIFPRNGEVDVISPPGLAVFTFAASEELLAETGQTALGRDLDDVLGGGEAVLEAPEAIPRLRRLFAGIHRSLSGDGLARRAPAAVSSLVYDVCAGLLSALAVGTSSQPRPSPRVRTKALQRALARIEACPEEPVTVRDLCRTAGASERTLRYAFHDRFGVSPNAYLKAVRLNHVRRELRRADPSETTVTEVAATWDFWHLGQFAADYRKLFGELPSHTLKRAPHARQ